MQSTYTMSKPSRYCSTVLFIAFTTTTLNLTIVLHFYHSAQQSCQARFDYANRLRRESFQTIEDCQFSKSLAKLDHANYHPVYERFFCRLKSHKFTMLEIGTGGYGSKSVGGESLHMFREYFPHAHIVSMDINQKQIRTPPRSTLIQGNQTDVELLERLCRNYKDLSLIIDDGSHNSPDIIFTFEHLWPCLETGGIYVVEDTQTSYWPESGSCDLAKPNTTMNYFKNLADEQNFKEIQWMNSAFRNHPFAAEILGLHFYHNLILIEKGDNSLNTNLGLSSSFRTKC